MRARGMSSGVGHKEERDDKMGGKPVSPDVLPWQPLPYWVKSTRTLLLCRARILPQQAALSAQSRRSPVRGFGDPFRAATLHRLDLCGIASTAPASASTSVIRNVDLTPMSFSPIASLSFDHQRRPDLACQPVPLLVSGLSRRPHHGHLEGGGVISQNGQRNRVMNADQIASILIDGCQRACLLQHRLRGCRAPTSSDV